MSGPVAWLQRCAGCGHHHGGMLPDHPCWYGPVGGGMMGIQDTEAARVFGGGCDCLAYVPPKEAAP